MKNNFHDRHDRIDYLKACEVARRIVQDPSLIADARDFLETWMLTDPQQRAHALTWRVLLQRPPRRNRCGPGRGHPARPGAARNPPGIRQGSLLTRGRCVAGGRGCCGVLTSITSCVPPQ